MRGNEYWNNLSPPALEFKQNKTLFYLFPALQLPEKGLLSIDSGYSASSGYTTMGIFGFKGVYWDWKECPNIHPYCLYLVFNPSGEVMLNKWHLFNNFLVSLKNFIEIYDVDVNLIVVCLQIDRKYREMIKWVKCGKYSKIDEKIANELFTVTDGKKSWRTKEWSIVMKSPKYKKELEDSLDVEISDEKELESCPIVEEEIFSYIIKE